jgi:hypothetical protein
MPDPADAFLLVFDSKSELHAWAIPFIRQQIAAFRNDYEADGVGETELQELDMLLSHEAWDDAIDAWIRFADDRDADGHFIVEEA